MDLQEYRSKLERKKGERDRVNKSILVLEGKIKDNKIEINYTEKAKAIIQGVAQKTQEQITYQINDIVTMANEAIFDDPYEFNLDFIRKRDKIEAEISFIKNKEKINPLSASGGGAVDVTCLALRIALWNLQRPKTRNVLILDEPLKFLSKNLLSKAGEMIKSLSDKLNLQIIMVTHLKELIDFGDKIFEVKINNGISEVK